MRDPGLQGSHVEPIKRDGPDPGQQPLQAADIVVQAAFVLVLQHKLCRGCFEGPRRSDTVDLGLPELLHQSREVSLRLFDLSCSRALANAPSVKVLVDVPDPASLNEAG